MPEGKREKEERGTSEQEGRNEWATKERPSVPQRNATKTECAPKSQGTATKSIVVIVVTLHWPTNGARPRFPFLVAKGGRTGDLFAVANVPKHQFVIPTVGLQVFGISTEINVRDVTGMAFHDCGAHVRLAVKDVNFVV
jgi:hypothetical protein